MIQLHIIVNEIWMTSLHIRDTRETFALSNLSRVPTDGHLASTHHFVSNVENNGQLENG